MARRRNPEPTQPSAPRRSSALVAAAAPVDISSKAQVERIKKRYQSWQPEAWAGYDTCGEAGHTLEYRANVISKVRQFGAFQPDGNEDPIPVDVAADNGLLPQSVANLVNDTMAKLHEGEGMAGLQHKQSLCLDVAGECHMVGETVGGVEQWKTYSDQEITEKSGRAQVDDDGRQRPLADESMVFRIWNPHPRKSYLARSPLMPLVLEGLLEELLLISKELRSGSKSRASKGILGVKQSVAMLNQATNVDGRRADGAEGEGGSFQDELIQMMTAPLVNDGAASEVVPWVVQIPDGEIKEWAHHISLGQTIDPNLLERAKYVIERIANGINMPKEITLGMGDVNHWGSHQIERSAFRAYVEPSVLSIAHAWTIGYLRPRLTASGIDPTVLARLCVWYDPEDAIAPENRVEQATAGVGINAIGRATWRREAGYDDDDAPTEDELVRFTGLGRGILTADLTLALLKLAGLVPQDVALTDSSAPGGPEPIALPPVKPDPQDTPADDTPPVTASAGPDIGARLAAIDRRLFDQVSTAADIALDHATERVVARLRTRAERSGQAALLADATAQTLHRRVTAEAARTLLREDEDPAVLMAGVFASLATRVDALVARAQDATVAEALALALDEDRPTDAELAQVATVQAEDRDRASSVLVASLTALALAVLFDGPLDAGPGEVDPNAVVPAGLVREVLAVAGGAQNIERTAAGGLSIDGRPVGGVATGERSRALFARVRAWWNGYRWEYGDVSARQTPFEPHLAMAGRVFARWDDDTLATPAGAQWLGSLTVSPGDHRGCRCTFVPTILTPVAEAAA